MGKLRAPRSARGRVMAAAGMVMVGSLGIQTSSSLSASLFGALGPIPVSSMRMLVAAIVILALTRPKLAGRSKGEWLGIVIYGLAMAAMNVCLYSAIDRIPMGVAVTLEFLGPCVVALAGSHHWREGLCAVVALVGVGLISFTPGGYFNPAGYLFALGSAVCFGLYTLFADRVGKAGTGLDGLALSVTVAALATSPVSITRAPHVSAAQWRHRSLGGAGSCDSLHDGHVVRAYHVGARGRHAVLHRPRHERDYRRADIATDHHRGGRDRRHRRLPRGCPAGVVIRRRCRKRMILVIRLLDSML